MMEGVFNFLKLVEEKKQDSLTRFAGTALFFEFLEKIKFPQNIAKHFPTCKQGYPFGNILLSLILVQLLGGESISDIQILETDSGLKRLWRKLQKKGWSFLEAKLRRETNRTFPSPTTLFDFLKRFRASKTDTPSKIWDARLSPFFSSLEEINEGLCRMQLNDSAQGLATLDMDNNIISSDKLCAQYSYKKEKSFAPFNVYHKESDLMLHSSFLDGNVKPGFGQKELLAQALKKLPLKIQEVFVRSDSAGYQTDFLRAMDQGMGRFHRINFSVSCKVFPAFRKAVRELKEEDWLTLKKRDEKGDEWETRHQVALVDYTPEWNNPHKGDSNFRYIAIREAINIQTRYSEKGEIQYDCSEDTEKKLHLESIGGKVYKVFGVVTNEQVLSLEEVVLHHWGRSGDSEKVHARLCSDFAGGRFPCDSFASNAAWWHISIIALNLTTLFQRFALQGKLRKCRMKLLRFKFFHLPARLIQRSTNLILKLKHNFSCFEEVRSRIHHLDFCLC